MTVRTREADLRLNPSWNLAMNTVEPRPLPRQPTDPPDDNPTVKMLIMGLLFGAASGILWEYKAATDAVPQSASAATETPTASAAADGARTSKRPTRPFNNVRPFAEPVAVSRGNANSPPTPQFQNAVPQRNLYAQPQTPPPSGAAPAYNRQPAVRQPMDTRDIRVSRVFVGGELISAGIVSESYIKKQQGKSRYVVCFEVSAGAALRCEDFRLEDREGTAYDPLCNLDGRSAGAASNGRSMLRVAFAVFNDSAPERLLYRSSDGRFAPVSSRAGR